MSHRYDGMIADAMAELAATGGGHTSIEKTLFELTSAAVQFISGIDCAGVLLIKDGEFQSLAATSPTATELDQVQLRTAEGPCLDAAERDVIVRSNDLRSETRWPRFAPQAVRVGVLSVMSFRLYTEGRDSGALNLLGYEPGSFAAEPEALGAMLATHAAVSLTAANRQHQFESALATRDLIGQAKGIIMERFDVDAVRAFELLRRISQDSNTPVSHIAARVTRRGIDPKDALTSSGAAQFAPRADEP